MADANDLNSKIDGQNCYVDILIEKSWYGKPEDVAAMTLFLCSAAASWITGQTYPVNGGYSFAV